MYTYASGPEEVAVPSEKEVEEPGSPLQAPMCSLCTQDSVTRARKREGERDIANLVEKLGSWRKYNSRSLKASHLGRES